MHQQEQGLWIWLWQTPESHQSHTITAHYND